MTPWYVDSHTQDGKRYLLIREVKEGPADGPRGAIVARVTSSSLFTAEQEEAHARVLAAGPVLLEAVHGLLDALPSATTHPAIKRARAAIAAADLTPGERK